MAKKSKKSGIIGHLSLMTPGRAIGYMKKSDLAVVARKELGMSLAEANAKTVVILKEKIRTNRKKLLREIGYGKSATPELRHHAPTGNRLTITRALQHHLDDPLALPPLGLGNMKLTELRDEVHTRGLPVIPDATREQMKMQIQEDADARWTSTVDEHGFKKTATTQIGERESDAINQNLENKKEEGGHD